MHRPDTRNIGGRFLVLKEQELHKARLGQVSSRFDRESTMTKNETAERRLRAQRERKRQGDMKAFQTLLKKTERAVRAASPSVPLASVKKDTR